jgi:hypothetical protein
VLEDKMVNGKDKPMCYGEAKHINHSMTQEVINNAVKNYNGRVLLNEVRSKLKWERSVIAKNDPRYVTINDKLMKLKEISLASKLLK